jgi:hypothetical protein
LEEVSKKLLQKNDEQPIPDDYVEVEIIDANGNITIESKKPNDSTSI